MSEIQYSVVVPVYNSVATLAPLYEAVAKTMEDLDKRFEVIFVEDYGIKESWIELKRLKIKYPEIITIVRLSKNFGQNGATLCGIALAKGQNVVTLDDDLKVHPSQIEKLINYQKEHSSDVVYGHSTTPEVSLFRKTGKRVLKFFMELLDSGENIGSSFRLITSNMIPLLQHHSQDHLFINQVISWYTHDVGNLTVEVNYNKEQSPSNYSNWQLITIGFRLILYYSSIPLKLITYLATISSITCFIFAGVYIYNKLTVGAVDGFTSIIVAIWVAAGAILLSISIISTYVNRIYDSRVKKRHYHIKTIE